MKQRTVVTLIIPALILCLCVLPAAAVIQEVTVKGTVASLNPEKNTLTIDNPLKYGCAYPASGDPVCSYTALDVPSLTGSVPAESVYSVFKTGDIVVATSLGGAGGTWISLEKLYGPLPAEEYVIDIVGDPGTMTAPLAGDYALDMTTVPDCTTCFGTTCKAATSNVNVLSRGTRVLVETLEPRQALMFNGRNDGSSIEVTFVKGEASSSACAGMRGMTGPQPVSVYIVKVVPPIGFIQPVTQTATTAIPTTVPATTKSGSLPVAVIGALGVVTAMFFARRN